MAAYRVAFVIRAKPSSDDGICDEDEILVVRQAAPPVQEGYEQFVDSDLFDLPSAPLNSSHDGAIEVENFESCSAGIDLTKFDLRSSIEEVMIQIGLTNENFGRWKYEKLVEEPDFGPDSVVHTLFILGEVDSQEIHLKDVSRWISLRCAFKLLKDVKPCGDRIGPLFVGMFFSGSSKPKWKITNTSPFQLADIVAELPTRLLIFVTHHHQDHINGLSVIQKSNPNALLLAQEKTMDRIGKEVWSGGLIKVSDGHKIFIGQDQWTVIFAPGHTDGHAGLLHVSSNSLIVGDHCVGKGSAVLDYRAGGNMKDYFETTYKFLDLSPHVVIPMHGRINCWPKRMLCGYLKHRRDREQTILEAICGGAQTLFEILAKSYADVDPKFWPAASSNVRLHVDYLAHQGKLPQGFSRERFLDSCGLSFLGQWLCGPLMTSVGLPSSGFAFLASMVAAIALSYLMH